ncbi:MAG: hypothetical protein K2K93_02470 [Muribaculaceae bacterium]|nr:hypothetical protein [Muribaculaceae bacterium]
MEKIGILAFGGAGWSYLRDLTVHYDAMSAFGKILLCVLFAAAMITSVSSSWWMSALARRSARKHVGDIGWIAVPNVGYYLPFILFFLLLPLFGIFSGRDDSWWILMIFGWLAALLIAVFMFELRLGLAVMKGDGCYWLSRRFGLGGWRPASSLTGLSARKTKFIGFNSYYLYYDEDGRSVRYAYLSDANFPSSSLPHLVEFIQEYKVE